MGWNVWTTRPNETRTPRLLVNVGIAAEIQRLGAERLMHADLKAERVLEELRRNCFSDIRSFFTPDGRLKPLHELTDEQAACVSSTEVVVKNTQAGDGVVDRVYKIRLWDKIRALEMAMQHFKLLKRHEADAAPVEVSVQVKTLAMLLNEQELQLIRERFREHSRKAPEETSA